MVRSSKPRMKSNRKSIPRRKTPARALPTQGSRREAQPPAPARTPRAPQLSKFKPFTKKKCCEVINSLFVEPSNFTKLCITLDEPKKLSLMKKYLGDGELTNDERELLLFAFYLESLGRKGLAYRALGIPVTEVPA